jgi:hypothetical protein
MPNMGKYCKAYPIERFREYAGWREASPPPNADSADVPGEDRYLYLQETFVVTRGIFLDEDVVFDSVTPEWETFCTQTLQFDPATA